MVRLDSLSALHNCCRQSPGTHQRFNTGAKAIRFVCLERFVKMSGIGGRGRIRIHGRGIANDIGLSVFLRITAYYRLLNVIVTVWVMHT